MEASEEDRLGELGEGTDLRLEPATASQLYPTYDGST